MHVLLLLTLALQSVSPETAQHMQAGVEAHKQKDYKTAIAEFRKASETDPNLPEAFLDLGEEYMQVRDYGNAIPALKRALANLVSNAVIYGGSARVRLIISTAE